MRRLPSMFTSAYAAAPLCQILLLVILISISGACCRPCQRWTSDIDALLFFKSKLSNAGGHALSSWNRSSVGELNAWQGVSWGPNERVEKLNLSGCGLTGTLMPIWGMLSSLTVLDISANNFSGTLDVSSDCSSNNLKVLKLSDNSLRGVLPHGISSLVGLEELHLNSNFFSGVIVGMNISALQSLKLLNLSQNNFTGGIPSEIGQLPRLEELDMSNNGFTGLIPTEFGQLSNLRRLRLFQNQLEETIPDSLGNCTKLFELDFSHNKLTRGIPADLGKLPQLSILAAGYNFLSGELQFGVDTFQRLQLLYLPMNRFHGNIPSSVGNLANLKRLVLQGNIVTGMIPPELGNCTQLEEIWLNVNQLTGSIPDALFHLSELRLLALDDNALSGPIPAGLSNCTNLEVLWLEQNNFSGEIPPSLGYLSHLLMMSLSGNNLVGNVPLTFTNLKKLIGLDVGYNDLDGGVPSSLAGLSVLEFLFLSNNRFNGSIPQWIGSFKALRALDFSFNNFTGLIPSNFRDLYTLKINQRYNDSAPSAVVHTPEGRTYKGFALPTTIDLSHNQLTGSIPVEIGILENLQILDLSHNSLSGSIPPQFSSACSLMKVDLSFNRLVGEIPSMLSNLSFLAFFNVAQNHLTGEVPNSPQFNTFNASWFAGNDDLCGIALNISCQKQSPTYRASGQKSEALKIMIKLLPLSITICVAVGICGSLILYLIFARRRQKLFSNGDGSERKLGFYETFSDSLSCKISPRQLAIATNNYNQANIIGDGGFGIVYRAVLETGEVVAVKKLSRGGIQGDREFHAEVQILGRIKNTHLVPLLGYCSDGNERLLIYKYLKNGSLDTWLYCREASMPALDWPTRLRIARGAAQGITFLHHERIVHRDIKVSNILLNEDFEAHVADFGMARLVNAGETHVSTEVAGTIGYIPPEYSCKSIATARGDVYSFGVVCLEILTAKRPTDNFFRTCGAGHLVAWVLGRKTSDEQRLALDSSMIGDGSCTDDMLEMMRVACLCCRNVPSRRPSMLEVVDMLEKLEKRVLASARSRNNVMNTES